MSKLVVVMAGANSWRTIRAIKGHVGQLCTNKVTSYWIGIPTGMVVMTVTMHAVSAMTVTLVPIVRRYACYCLSQISRSRPLQLDC